MEMDAWDIVRKLAPQLKLKIDELHISRCIASYDEWLSKRATCPDCDNFSLQKGRQSFACFACGSTWNVNERKDRRVMRTVTSRFSHTTLAPSFGEKPHQD
jgi:tRNA(Ile2) C34 agmatinyltransferase TiaS